jgi:zinc/manganese transport system substrate-binding protein
VASTTVLADLVARTGGDLVTATSLVPAGGEVHTFDPSPSDARRVAEADLIVINGLGLDEWVLDLAEGAAGETPIVELAEDLEGVRYLASDGDHEDVSPDASASHEEGHGEIDPHLWMDVSYTRAYVRKLAGSLAAADPANADHYAATGRAYEDELAELDSWVEREIAAVPPEARRVISLHDAFSYFAAAYGLDVVGTVIDAPGQEPSAGEVAALIDTIRAEEVRAILSEAQFPDDLVATIAREIGVDVVDDLYTDSLGPAPVDSYDGLMRWDVERIVAALR